MVEIKHKVISHLGLATRASKCVTGDEKVMQAIRNKQAKLVILSTDASDGTKKKVMDKCKSYDIPLFEYMTMEEIGNSTGKSERATAAVMDAGFAKMIHNCIAQLAEVNKY
ncbi:L7Ae/L30e/S12e/Gadd45 family ribosomal protein [Longirhabdus pacifica]|uniref:L7Ae/L30e/S12e/Gadd45 family ribosomal protein n=1 Tax=Longirhabdus pacifica TaxID=2305227 RepID=UPI001F0CAA88|nr:ribosomal L7Ae/L30e/S12e/Gadd45 family protein [Longirhabdus pacifica]